MRTSSWREQIAQSAAATIAMLILTAAGCSGESASGTAITTASSSPGTAAPAEPPCIGAKDLDVSGRPDLDGNMLATLLLERCGDRLPMDLTAALKGLAAPMGAVDPALANNGVLTAFARVCTLDAPPESAATDRVAMLGAVYDACKLEASGHASRGEFLSAPDVARAMLGVALSAALLSGGLLSVPAGDDPSDLARRIAHTIARMDRRSPRRWADTAFFTHTETGGSPIPSDAPERTGHVLYLRPDSIDLGEEHLLALEEMRIAASFKKDGVHVTKLFDSLYDANVSAQMDAKARAGGPPPPLLIAVDGRIPSRTLMEALITADSAGWQRFALLPSRFPDERAADDVPAEEDAFAPRLLPPSADLPTRGTGAPGPKHLVVRRKGPPGADRLHVHVTASALRVRAGSRLLPPATGCPADTTWCALDESTWNNLLTAARSFKEAVPDGSIVQISAAAEVPVSTLLEVIAATRFRREHASDAADAETPRLLPSAVLVLEPSK